MRILCINYEYPPIGGGGGVACKGLTEALVRRGHHVDVVTSGMRDLPEFEIVEGVRIHRVKCYRRNRVYAGSLELLFTLYPMYAKAKQLVEQHTYDINHTHFIVPSGIVSYWLKRKTGLPYIITAHGSDVPDYNPDRFYFEHYLIRWFWRRIIRNSRAIISPSNYLKKLISKQKCQNNLIVVPYGYTPTDGLVDYQGKENTILVATRMFKRKGVQHVIEALRGMTTDWEILIAGDGPYLDVLKKQARNVEANIRFVGFLSRKEMDAAYKKSKIFLFPSIQENYPMVLIEAMNAVCAVITTNAEGCSEVVADAAIKIAPAKINEIRHALNLLLNNDSEIIRLGEMSKQRARQLAWPQIALQMETIICNVLNSLEQSVSSQPLGEILTKDL